MSYKVYEAHAQLGAYSQRTPEFASQMWRIMGEMASKPHMTPDQGLAEATRLTANSNLPFAQWRQEQGDSEAVQDRVALQVAYEPLADVMHRTTRRFARFRSGKPGINLGRGQDCAGYLLGYETDEPVVVKRIADRSTAAARAQLAEQRVNMLLQGKTVSILEQARALSYRTSDVGVTYMPGPAMGVATEADLANITSDTAAEAAEGVMEASNKGVVFDFIGDNINIAPDGRLGFFDPRLVTQNAEHALEWNRYGFVLAACTAGGELPRRQQTRGIEEARRGIVAMLVQADPELAPYVQRVEQGGTHELHMLRMREKTLKN